MKNITTSLLFLFIFTNTLFSQEVYQDEVQDDPYIHVPVKDQKYSPAYQATFKSAQSSITTIQVNTSENGMNILQDAANEPSIGIDPTNPLRMVIGWRQFETIESNFRQAGIAYTEDGGLTWTNMPPLEAEFFRSDPVIDTDSEGNFYYNSLNTDLECDVFIASDLEDWTEKKAAYGGDKQWMVIDKTNQVSNGQTYAFWAAAASSCQGSFTRAIDFENGFEPCSNIPASLRRGTINIDPNGDLYACGSVGTTFRVLKSTTAKTPGSSVTFEQDVLVDMKGETSLYQGPNPNGMLGQAWVATDHSDTDLNSNVYLLATVERSASNDNADVMFSRSTDGGLNWSEAIKINDDGDTNWNWFGTISVAPNGRIDVTWVDTRPDPGSNLSFISPSEVPESYLSSLYYSYSMDGGLNWSSNEKLTDAFNPHLGFPNQNKIGDYYHMISTNEGAHLAWAGTFTGGQDVYYSYITPVETISNTEEVSAFNELSIFPNPSSNNFNIQFENEKNTQIRISLLNIAGQEIRLLRDVKLSAGTQNILIDQQDLGPLDSGLYFIKLSNNFGLSTVKKLTFVK